MRGGVVWINRDLAFGPREKFLDKNDVKLRMGSVKYIYQRDSNHVFPTEVLAEMG